MELRNIQEPIFIFMFLIDRAHKCRCGRKHFIDEDEDGLFRGKFNAFANDIAELSDRQV